MTLLGVILTGGQSTRMGTDKALVEVAGHTMLDRVARALTPNCDRVVLIGRSYPGFDHLSDDMAAPGPLSGIVTALHHAKESHVLVVAVDQAFLREETVAHLGAMAGELAVVPVDEHGVRQVTCAVYPKGLGTVAEEELASGGSVQSLLDRASFQPVTPDIWAAWGEDGRSWFSVDDPGTFSIGLARYQPT